MEKHYVPAPSRPPPKRGFDRNHSCVALPLLDSFPLGDVGTSKSAVPLSKGNGMVGGGLCIKRMAFIANFEDPIPLHDGTQLEPLREANLHYLAEVKRSQI